MTDTTGGLRLDAETRTAINGLDDASRDRLDGLIADADRGQRTQIEQAVEDAMAIVPALLRKRVRKMIMG